MGVNGGEKAAFLLSSRRDSASSPPASSGVALFRNSIARQTERTVPAWFRKRCAGRFLWLRIFTCAAVTLFCLLAAPGCFARCIIPLSMVLRGSGEKHCLPRPLLLSSLRVAEPLRLAACALGLEPAQRLAASAHAAATFSLL